MSSWRCLLGMAILCWGTADAKPLVLAHYMTVYTHSDADYARAMTTAYAGEGIGVGDAPLLASKLISGNAPWGNGFKDFVRHEVSTAQSAGIDGFLLDYSGGGTGESVHNDLACIDGIFAVVEQEFPDFRLGLALDQSATGGNYERRKLTIQQFLQRHGNSPVLVREHGHVLFFSYRATSLEPHKMLPPNSSPEAYVQDQLGVIQNWQRLWNSVDPDALFIADLPPAWYWQRLHLSDATIRDLLQRWARAFAGISVFAPDDSLDQARALYPLMGSICKANDKIYMAPVWWGYYPPTGHVGLPSRILMDGADMALGSWALAKQSQADWVELVTWNDFLEQTDWAPSVNHGYGLFDLVRIYSAWFKTGKFALPAVPEVILFYRRFLQHPEAPLVSGVSPWIPLDDQVDVVTVSRADGTLKLGGNPPMHISKGIESHRFPLEVGEVSATLTYDGGKTVNATGLVPVVESPKRMIWGTYIASSTLDPEIVEQTKARQFLGGPDWVRSSSSGRPQWLAVIDAGSP